MCFDHRVLTGRRASLDALVSVLPRVWCANTAWIDDWDMRNPARGQCGTTALVVQDLHGGEVATGLVQSGFTTAVHYWNVLASGPVDLTWQQFPATARVLHSETVLRAEMLRNSWFIDRYEALRDRVQTLFGNHGLVSHVPTITTGSHANVTGGVAPPS